MSEAPSEVLKALYREVANATQQQGLCVALMDLCMSDAIDGAKAQITSLATVSGLIAGFTATVLAGISSTNYWISIFLIGSAVCNISAMVISSMLLVVLFMDFTQLPQCRQRGRLTTHLGPLYVFAYVVVVVVAAIRRSILNRTRSR